MAQMVDARFPWEAELVMVEDNVYFLLDKCNTYTVVPWLMMSEDDGASFLLIMIDHGSIPFPFIRTGRCVSASEALCPFPTLSFSPFAPHSPLHYFSPASLRKYRRSLVPAATK